MNNIFFIKFRSFVLGAIIVVSAFFLSSCFNFDLMHVKEYVELKSITTIDKDKPSEFQIIADVSNPNTFFFKIKVRRITLYYQNMVIPLKVADEGWQKVKKGKLDGLTVLVGRQMRNMVSKNWVKTPIILNIAIDEKKLKNINLDDAIKVIHDIAKGKSMSMKVGLKIKMWRFNKFVMPGEIVKEVRFPLSGQKEALQKGKQSNTIKK